MSATAAVRGLFRIPRAGPTFRRIEAGEDAGPKCGWNTRVANIRNILARDGYTITQLSAATRRRYGSRSPYFIPATFLYQLRSGVTPHVCQIVALSESTGYRFVDWMRICGYELRQVPALQMQVHPERTVLVTPMDEGVEPFSRQNFMGDEERCRAATCSRSGERWGGRHHLFAKIGTSDGLACPQLSPGSVVRVDRCFAQRIRGVDRAAMTNLLWLVERPGGLTCCRVKWIGDQQIVLLPARQPWGLWPLHLPTEARILGLVDNDLGPTELNLQSRVGQTNVKQFSSQGFFPLHCREERMNFSSLLRISRGRTGLTFRAAHRLTRAVAQILGSPDYGIALGMLSDYEAGGKLPRHVAKILSLCVVYCVDFRDLMEAAGVSVDDSGKSPLSVPDERMPVRSEFLHRSAHSGTNVIVTGYACSAGAQS
jgi:hypothetical protein